MDIKDFLSQADALVDLRAPDKVWLLKDLSRRAAASLELDAVLVSKAILAREELGSTGMGGGVAIPHARIPELKKPFGILACLKKPIGFDAIDAHAVDVVIFLLLPSDPSPEHLHALATVARALRNPDLVAKLRRARDGAEAYGCFACVGQ
jgi:PTS system nitrogen regulatory IIA component